MPAKNKDNKAKKPVKANQETHKCPYCDAEMRQGAFPYCVACSINFVTCPSCNTDFSRDQEYCPECGAENRKPMIGI